MSIRQLTPLFVHNGGEEALCDATLNNEIYGENLFRRIMNIDLNLCFFCRDTKLLTAGGLSDQLPIVFKAFGMIMNSARYVRDDRPFATVVRTTFDGNDLSTVKSRLLSSRVPRVPPACQRP